MLHKPPDQGACIAALRALDRLTLPDMGTRHRTAAVFPTFADYRSSYLVGDILGGITLAAIVVPGQIAIAHLAGMPSVAGLYGSAAACFFIALFAANRVLTGGCDSTIAPLLAGGIGLIATVGSDHYTALVILTTFLAGLMLLVIGIAKLGWIADFLSKPIVTGFMAGVAITIIVDQLPGILGVPGSQGHVLHRLASLAGELGLINWLNTLIGVLSLAALLAAGRYLPRIPGALLVLILAIGAVSLFDLPARGISVLGDLPQGLPPLTLPQISFDNIRAVLPTALAVVLIVLAQTAATSRSSAEAGGFATDINADFRALGAANTGASLVGGFAVNASPSGTVITAQMRARSQLASVLCGVILLIFALFAGGLLHNLPMATLSAILVFISIKIFKVSDMVTMWRFSMLSFSSMLVTLLGVVILGVELGILIAVVLAILDRTRRSSRPEILELESDRDSLIYHLNGPLWFGNANWFKQTVLDELEANPDVRWLVLDTTGIDDMDYTGVVALEALANACPPHQVAPVLVTHPGLTREAIDRSGMLHRTPLPEYPTVPAALAAVHISH